jgi:dihydrofolate synthase / folylpolyglutamate synthase
MRSYPETVDYIFSKLPMFTRIGPAAYKADLNNIKALSKALGNPHKSFKTVHVAGTNGKGSTSHLLASALQEAGLQTGLFTSPHLLDFRERIRWNGNCIPEEKVVEFVNNIEPLIDEIQPSFFEITVALAFWWFAQLPLDIAVIETGLGGRLDSTNIIIPELSVITNISWDHMNLLGDTLPLIAKEKAGIIKAGVPVVVGQTQPEIQSIFSETASEKRALLKFADAHFRAELLQRNLFTAEYRIWKNQKVWVESALVDLPGSYQQHNIATALGALDQLQRMGWAIETEHFLAGFQNVRKNTGLRGRWEVIHENPLAIADVGHNEAGMLENKAVLESDSTTWHYVIGVVNDKDLVKMVEQLPKNACFYASRPQIPRGLETEKLAEALRLANRTVQTFDTVMEAYQAALIEAEKAEAKVFVGGSTFVVAEALPLCPIL